MAKAKLITQKEAAELKGMTLAAVNELVRRGRWRSVTEYGRRLVYRSDVEKYEPQARKSAKAKGSGKRRARG